MTDINEIIGRAMWEQRRRFAAEQAPDLPLEEWGDGSIPAANGVLGEVAAVVKALGEAGYEITEIEPAETHLTEQEKNRQMRAALDRMYEEPPAGIKGLSDI